MPPVLSQRSNANGPNEGPPSRNGSLDIGKPGECGDYAARFVAMKGKPSKGPPHTAVCAGKIPFDFKAVTEPNVIHSPPSRDPDDAARFVAMLRPFRRNVPPTLSQCSAQKVASP